MRLWLLPLRQQRSRELLLLAALYFLPRLPSVSELHFLADVLPPQPSDLTPSFGALDW
ncbi:hypothetical protein Syncc8109_1368 [Synechococcus sp. WH 8109]|nr:hypothetical protein Syncc8109_1368 [Synechococcus sp. WH 8109]